MDSHTFVAINGRSVRVVRRSPSRDSRRSQEAGSPIRVERDCPPLTIAASELRELASRVRRLTVTNETAADEKMEVLRTLGRLAKRMSA